MTLVDQWRQVDIFILHIKDLFQLLNAHIVLLFVIVVIGKLSNAKIDQSWLRKWRLVNYLSLLNQYRQVLEVDAGILAFNLLEKIVLSELALVMIHGLLY